MKQLRVVFANAATESILGFSPDELLGKDANVLIPPSIMTVQEHKQKVARYLKSPNSNSGAVGTRGREVRIFSKDGREVPVLVSLKRMDLTEAEAEDIIEDYASRHVNDNVPPILFVVCLQDLTAAKERAETKQAAKAQKMILDFVLHEVRNPLLGIDAGTSLMQEELNELLRCARLEKDDEGAMHGSSSFAADPGSSANKPQEISVPISVFARLHSDLENVRSCVGHMHRLVSNVLDSERLAEKGDLMPLRLEEVSVQDCFEQVLRMVKFLAKTGVAINGTLAKEVPPLIMTDRQRLIQVIMNLVTNAIKYTDAGHVTISASVAHAAVPFTGKPSPHQTPSSKTTGEEECNRHVLVVRCEDSGRGISVEDQEGLFTTKFCTLLNSKAGTGLGLMVSKTLVEKMGGNISVESDVNDETKWPPAGTTGSAFIVKLPIVLPERRDDGSQKSSNDEEERIVTVTRQRKQVDASGTVCVTEVPSPVTPPTQNPLRALKTRTSPFLSPQCSAMLESASRAGVSSQSPKMKLFLPPDLRVLVADDSRVNRTLMKRVLQSRTVAPSWEVEEAENGVRLCRSRETHNRSLMIIIIVHLILWKYLIYAVRLGL